MRVLTTLSLVFILCPLFPQKPHESGQYVLKIYHLDSIQSHPLILEQEKRDFSLLRQIINTHIEMEYEIIDYWSMVHLDSAMLEKIYQKEVELKIKRDSLIAEIQRFSLEYKKVVKRFVLQETDLIESAQLLYFDPKQVVIENCTEILIQNFIQNIQKGQKREDWRWEMMWLYWRYMEKFDE